MKYEDATGRGTATRFLLLLHPVLTCRRGFTSTSAVSLRRAETENDTVMPRIYARSSNKNLKASYNPEMQNPQIRNPSKLSSSKTRSKIAQSLHAAERLMYLSIALQNVHIRPCIYRYILYIIPCVPQSFHEQLELVNLVHIIPSH